MAPPILTIPLSPGRTRCDQNALGGVGSLDCLLSVPGRWVAGNRSSHGILPEFRLSLVDAVTNVFSKNLARVVKALHGNVILESAQR